MHGDDGDKDGDEVELPLYSGRLSPSAFYSWKRQFSKALLLACGWKGRRSESASFLAKAHKDFDAVTEYDDAKNTGFQEARAAFMAALDQVQKIAAQ